ncbi:hypothetical protein [Corallococcus sicarius]|uniref:Uncharacterized protein n=1 Tax=Corallococcus sicarius TaxID=2316726 RepID=A0A3A8NU67_9BACT|nr:hypothetical protein [Corallococcus sicarius]RKH46850.1 hypothetical protein D7X12_04440 [Corallococcus sicarius]
MPASASVRFTRGVLCATLLTAGCAGPANTLRHESPAPLPPPPTSVALTVGYEEAVRLGAAYARNLDYEVKLVTAKQGEASWWLHYAAPEGRPPLALRVDGQTAQVEPVPPPPSPAK